jgi:hypothetical protein
MRRSTPDRSQDRLVDGDGAVSSFREPTHAAED